VHFQLHEHRSHQPSMVRQLSPGTGTSEARQVLECASPLALWARAIPKRQRTAAVQDAVAARDAPAQLVQEGFVHTYGSAQFASNS